MEIGVENYHILQLRQILQGERVNMFDHFNFYYVLAPLGLLVVFLVGYLRVFDQENGRRMCWYSKKPQTIISVLVAVLTGLCIFAESHAGILTVISGGKTAEQIARDGADVALAVILLLACVVVYAVALVGLVCLCEHLKLRKLNRARRQTRIAAAAADAAVADAEIPAETAPQDDRPTLTIIDTRETYVLESIAFDLSPRTAGSLLDHDQAAG